MSAAPLLRLEDIGKRFGDTVALAGLSLSIGQGEFVVLLGGSGSGKTTLLRLVAGFETPDEGRILLAGRDLAGLPPQDRPVGMMFQSYALFPHLSVFDNIAYGLRRDGVAKPEIARRVAEALAMVGLQGLAARRPQQISGGQQQRVALVRALVRRPALLLLDEPLAALDAGLRERTGFELRALQQATGTAFVMVTHDQREALSLADRVAVLEAGRLAQFGTPEALYERPATRYVAGFLGAANLLEGVVRDDGAVDCAPAGCTLRPASTLPGRAGQPVTVALRPERIALLTPGEAPAENAARGVVREVGYQGADRLCQVVMPGGAALRVRLPGAAPAPAPGAPIGLAWPADAVIPLAD